MQTKAKIEVDAGVRTFATGLLPELIGVLRRCDPGDLVSLTSRDGGLGKDVEAWCRFTHNTLVDTNVESGRTRWVIRCGEAPANTDAERPIGSRLWLYTNFDCNLHCDYCLRAVVPQGTTTRAWPLACAADRQGSSRT